MGNDRMMPAEQIYWRDWTEEQLAAFQQDQGNSNHCAKYAAASALNLLYGKDIPGEKLISWLEKRPLKGTGRYTIWGNHNGSLVYQTANLLKTLARQEKLDPQVKCSRKSPLSLAGSLYQENNLALISVTYFQGAEPRISRGNSTVSSLGTARWVSGHVMILAAYDPWHFDLAGMSAPWGFISSWSAKDQLYWMTEADFLDTWGRLSLFNTVTVTRSPTSPNP